MRLERAGAADTEAPPQEDESAGGVYNLSAGVEYGHCRASGGVRAVALRRPDERLVLVLLNCARGAKAVRVEMGGSNRLPLDVVMPPRAIRTYVFAR